MGGQSWLGNCPILRRLIIEIVVRLSSRYAGILIRYHGRGLFVNAAVKDTDGDIQPGAWLILNSLEVTREWESRGLQLGKIFVFNNRV